MLAWVLKGSGHNSVCESLLAGARVKLDAISANAVVAACRHWATHSRF